MKKARWILGFIALAMITSSLCYAEEWAITYSTGIENDREFAYSVRQTVDGGYIVAALLFASPSYDGLLLKLNQDGSIDWKKRYLDLARLSAEQTSDGGYILSGHSFTEGLNIILKVNAAGEEEWQKTYGRACYTVSTAKQTADGGYIVAASTVDDVSPYGPPCNISILKLDSNGNVEWDTTFGASTGTGDSDRVRCIQQTADGGYIVAGITTINGGVGGYGGWNTWLLKLNFDGTIAWQKIYTGIGRVSSIQQTTDGGYIASVEDKPCSIMKLNSEGVVEWNKSVGYMSYGSHEKLTSLVLQTMDNGYVAAFSAFLVGARDIWIVKLDSYGNVEWDRVYGGSYDDIVTCIQQTEDAGYVLAGYTDSFSTERNHYDAWVLKLNSDGVIPGCNVMSITGAVPSDIPVTDEDTTVEALPTSMAATGSTYIPQNVALETSLTCDGVAADPPEPRIVAFPTSHNFGQISVGNSSSPFEFAISNLGNANLEIGNVSLTGEHASEFSLTNDTCSNQTLIPLTTCKVEVIYSPTSIGAKTANLSVPTNDPLTPIFEMPLTGDSAPFIDKLRRKRREPGQKTNIIGSNFGPGDPGDYVRIGSKKLAYDHNRIIEWTPTNIKVKIPKKSYVKNGCAWFQGLDEKKVKVWVNVGGVDSNKKRLTLIKNPADCQ